ncbi:bacterial proteasome activator family protein [Nocardioides sp. GY 10127]|uniref:bacterial proteasome activator family protein n=1 Tax=Nocardioides sp. GY 10127 TaxID=2569762 RepID=UPI0010A754F7|nr:bacterial proteasome activator family protein [Nocardioides sp. GY 10127]TIC82697.1 bacterial proteasome activator family protein [Nocardioides sp. GY 10127]
MSEQQQGHPADGEQQVVIVGPDGQPMAAVPASALAHLAGAPGEAGAVDDEDAEGDEGRSLTELVEQPAKVMRIGTMIRQLLEEVKAAPLDEASRQRLKEIHQASVAELETGLAPELVEELQRLSLPFTEDAVPSEGELRIAQAQLVGWLEGLFHGIQTAIYAQQMAARAQMEHGRRGLPAGLGQGGVTAAPGATGGAPDDDGGHRSGGMYL